MTPHWRHRLPRTRTYVATSALTGRPVMVSRATLWGRLLLWWEMWRRPR